MDFLDPKKQRAHRLRLLIGYVLIGLVLAITTVVLLYEAYGFGIGENGQIIQNGLVFIGSEPSGANIFLNGALKAQTSARLNIPAGQYTVAIQRDGYQTWRRSIGVEGGSVEHFVYPFLVPSKLKPATVAEYKNQPSVLLQSPDQRWLLLPDDSTFGVFNEYDLAHPKNPFTSLAMPANVLTASTGAQTWQLVAWANDNVHVLLRHTFAVGAQTSSEYVLLNRADSSQTINLTKTLGVNPTTITLRNGAYDQYYLYDQPAQTLATASLSEPTAAAFAQHVLAYDAAASGNTLIYIDSASATSGKVTVRMRQGNNSTYVLGHLPANTHYLLSVGTYGGNWFASFGDSADNKVSVYKNPAGQLSSDNSVLVPVAVLKVTNPTTLSLSQSNQFLMAESGNNFAVFDADTAKTYTYTIKQLLDAPQTSAVWMDNFHLLYVAGGKLLLFDFDSANQRTLVSADATLTSALDANYHTLYAVAPQPNAASGVTTYALTSTSLLTPADQ